MLRLGDVLFDVSLCTKTGVILIWTMYIVHNICKCFKAKYGKYFPVNIEQGPKSVYKQTFTWIQ